MYLLLAVVPVSVSVCGNSVSASLRIWRARAPASATDPRKDDDEDDGGGNDEEERVKQFCERAAMSSGFTLRVPRVMDGHCFCCSS